MRVRKQGLSAVKSVYLTCWNFVEGFINKEIPRNAFWELVKFSYPTHQVVFCTQEALETLTFEGSKAL